MSQADVQESHAQLTAFWKKLARAMDAPAVTTAPGVDCIFGNVAIPFFNVVTLLEPVTSGKDLDHRLQAAQTFADGHPCPWFLIAADDATPGDLLPVRNQTFAAAGLHPAMALTGMIADQLPTATLSPLTLRPATNTTAFAAIGDINSQAYEMPAGAGVGIMDRPNLFQDGHPIVGYENGEAVSCALSTPLDGCLYVAFVATLPTHRRKGYAEACMKESLGAASSATGITRSVLHATDAGRPIYARMGYRPVATYTLFGQAH